MLGDLGLTFNGCVVLVCVYWAAPWECCEAPGCWSEAVDEWEEGKQSRMRYPLQRLCQANLIPLLQPISHSTLAPCEPSGPPPSISNDPD